MRIALFISDASSLPEVGGNAAIQLSPTDEKKWTEAMIELLTNQGKLVYIREAGIKQASLFSWNKAAVELMHIYEYLLELQQ